MTIEREARTEWRRLRAAYPVELAPYTFKVNGRLKRRLGQCKTWFEWGTERIEKGTVEVARDHVDAGPVEEVLDTLRHEVAHALAIARHGRDGSGHGPAWRAAAVELGANPSPYGSREACEAVRKTAPAPYLLTCTRCEQAWERYKVAACWRDEYRVHADCGGRIVVQQNPAA